MRTESIYTIFLASPGDVVEERDAVDEAVSELNLANHGYQFEVIRWETYVPPGVGEDAQDVVNKAIPDDYDIFLAILWTHIGSSTGRAISGTVEEFNRAYARFTANPKSVKIMLYFKDSPVPPSAIDVTQLKALNAFRDDLKKRGVLYHEFSTIHDFERLLRIHLPKQVLSLADPASAPLASGTRAIAVPVTNAVTTEEQEELGYLDFLVQMEDEFALSTEIMTKMTSELEALGNKLQSRTAEIETLPTVHGSTDVRGARRIGNAAAEDMNFFSGAMEQYLQDLALAYDRAMDATAKALALAAELDVDRTELLPAADAAADLRETIRGVIASLSEFRAQISEMPRATGKMIMAKKRLIRLMDAMVADFARIEGLAGEIEMSMRESAGQQPNNPEAV